MTLLLSESLDDASAAYAQALDSSGAEVARRVRQCLECMQVVDGAWTKLVEALSHSHAANNGGGGGAGVLDCEYSAAVEHLARVRHALRRSAEGLPLVNSTLDSIVAVVASAEHTARGMISVLALEA